MKHLIINEGPHEIIVSHMLGNDAIGYHLEGHVVKPGEGAELDIRAVHHGNRRAKYRIEPIT